MIIVLLFLEKQMLPLSEARKKRKHGVDYEPDHKYVANKRGRKIAVPEAVPEDIPDAVPEPDEDYPDALEDKFNEDQAASHPATATTTPDTPDNTSGKREPKSAKKVFKKTVLIFNKNNNCYCYEIYNLIKINFFQGSG